MPPHLSSLCHRTPAAFPGLESPSVDTWVPEASPKSPNPAAFQLKELQRSFLHQTAAHVW